jgi:dihydrofolate reductase
MPRIRYSVAMSVDGYIAGPNGEFDWILTDPTFDFAALFAEFDTFLVGRRTFEVMRRPGSPPLPRGSDVFVFSRTLTDEFDGVSVLREASPAIIAEIKTRAKRDIWLFGGGSLFRSLLSQGFVDTVELKIMPVLLGAGIPLLPPPAQLAALNLTAHHISESGIAYLNYSVPARPSLNIVEDDGP